MSRQPLLLLVFVFYCQICLDALALTVNLKCVDTFCCAIKQQAPSYDKQRQRCRLHWLNQYKQASEEYHRRAYPEHSGTRNILLALTRTINWFMAPRMIMAPRKYISDLTNRPGTMVSIRPSSTLPIPTIGNVACPLQ